MVNHWAILIGINQYQFLQPLNYAQQDAQALQECLVEEAGFAADHCLLLTDTSPPIRGRSTYPTRATIEAWIDELCRKHLQPGDLLWCFFSGYGVCLRDEDYLLPIDGNFTDIPATAISVRSLLERIESVAVEGAMVLLDINRSQGLLSDEAVGVQTLALAQSLGVTTILSCQPDEFSHETAALGHGFFTAVLLEGLRYAKFDTLGELDQYLRDRLPELTEHHLRPAQNPAIAVNPPEKLRQGVLPGSLAATGTWNLLGQSSQAAGMASSANPGDLLSGSAARIGSSSASATAGRMLSANGNNSNNATGPDSAASRSSILTASNAALASLKAIAANRGGSGQPTASSTSSTGATSNATSPSSASAEAEEVTDPGFSWRFLLGGGLIVLLLLIGVLLRNRAVFTGESVPQTAVSPTAKVVQPTTTPQPTPQPTAIASIPSASPQPTNNASPLASPVASPPATPARSTIAPTTAPVAPTSPIESARTALQSDQPQQALQILNQVPASQRQGEYRSLQTQAEQRANQKLLEQARVSIRPSQASRFSQAITQARKIQPGQPLYAQAQQDIERWSRVILDLAEGRANQGQYDAAIAAARLVPNDNAQVYAQSQQAIANWQKLAQQQQVNRNLLQAAERDIRWDEASSYNRAIAQARKVPLGQPGYLEAKRLINNWSQNILQIAEARAARGRLQTAINTASLIPSDTPTYANAQKAIANWKRQLGRP